MIPTGRQDTLVQLQIILLTRRLMDLVLYSVPPLSARLAQ